MSLLFNILSRLVMATHSSILAWKIPWAEEPGRLQSMGSLRVGHDWATLLSLFTFMHWRRKWKPTPLCLPGESQGQRSPIEWAAIYGVAQSRTRLKRLSSRLVITFLPRSRCLLISWLHSPSAVILEPPKIKSVTVSIVSPSVCHEVMGPDAMILFSEYWVLSQLFNYPLSLSSRGSLVLLCFLHKSGVICVFEIIDISSGSLDSSLCFIQPWDFTLCTLHIS